jgi:putative peptidoglycan lipid II flippase
VSGVVADDALVAPPRRLGRAAASVGALTLLSRLTGFVRVLVVTAVLGRGVLGDTYETANTVPNLLFELVAAGALQAVLVPAMVEVLDRDGRAAAERVAGAVLGALASLLGAVAAIAVVAAPWIMRAFTSGTDGATYDAKVELGTLFLWFFLPQMIFYAVGLVASAVLNSEQRFNVPAVAPAVNNIVVLGTYAIFWVMRDGAPPSVDLTTAEKVVLAGGTTLGVLAFTLLPAIAVVRRGFHLRPRLDWRDPTVRTLGRRGAWAGGQLAMANVLLAVVLVLANGVAGGVVTWTFAYAFFLLPIALFAVPVATTMFPSLARSHQAGRRGELGAALGRGVRATVALLVGAAAALTALAWPIVHIAAFGDARTGGLAPLAHALAAFAPGLVGYGLVYLLTRASYAVDDARTPFLAIVAGSAAGIVAMIVAAAWAPSSERAAALAVGYGIAYLVATVILAVALGRRLGPDRPHSLGVVARIVAAGAVTLAVMAAVVTAFDAGSRTAAVVTLISAGAIGAALYAGALRVLTGVPLRRLVTIDDG